MIKLTNLTAQTALQCYEVRFRSHGNVHKCKNAHWGDNCHTT